MRHLLILLLLFWDNVELILAHEECSELPAVEHAFVSDEYKKTEYQKGDVINFSCEPGYTTGVNGTYICTEHGWSAATVGQCIANFCEKPLVDNGTLQEDKEKYRPNEVLLYSCKPGYRKVDGRPSVCLKVDSAAAAQWSPTPQCEAITCKLSSNPPEGTAYNPLNQIIFSPGQTVTVSCGDEQWVKNTELQSAELTCQDTGDWDFEPVCKLLTCSKIEENVYRWQSTFYSTVNIGGTLSYHCRQGFVETSPTGRATCTRRGWEPNPLCKDASPPQ